MTSDIGRGAIVLLYENSNQEYLEEITNKLHKSAIVDDVDKINESLFYNLGTFETYHSRIQDELNDGYSHVAPLTPFFYGQFRAATFNSDEFPERSQPAVESLCQLLSTLYEATKPVAAYVVNPAHWNFDLGGPPVTQESLAENRIEYLPWAMVFTPPMVETYGRERLLSAPVESTRELDDGSILVLWHPDVRGIADDSPLWNAPDHIGVEGYLDRT